jgi:hypothetical protein
MPDHAHESGLLLQACDRLRGFPIVGERNLYLHVLSCLQALQGLIGVQLRRRTQDCCFDTRLRQRFAQIGCDMRDAVLRCGSACRFQFAPDQRDDVDATDLFDRIQMLLTESAGAGEDHLHCEFSRIR